MKRYLKYYWILLVIGGILLISALALWKTNRNLGIIFLTIACLMVITYGILEPFVKKEKLKEDKNKRLIDEHSENGALESHKDDNVITKVIYSIYKEEIAEIKEILDNSIAEVEFDYNEEDNMYSLGITSCDVKNKKKPVDFMMVIYSSDEEKSIIVDEEEDISNLSEEELIDKIVGILQKGIQPYELTNFEINRPKSQFVLGLVVSIISTIGAIAFTILGILKVFELALGLSVGAFCLFFLVLGVLQLVACKNEKFIYTGKEFIYRKINNKECSCFVSKVNKVYLYAGSRSLKVVFVDKDDNELMKFSDDSWIVKDKQFLYAMVKNKVKVETVFL